MATAQEIIDGLRQQVGFAAGQAKAAVAAAQQAQGQVQLQRQELERLRRDMENLGTALSGVRGNSFGGGNVPPSLDIRLIESIPGRRIPYDFMGSIPLAPTIGAGGTVSGSQVTKTIPQDGPFVAVARMASFQSAYQFARTDPTTGAVAAFQGRSFGRFRPIHSAWDLNDAQAGVLQPVAGLAFPGTGAPIVASPANLSGFRTMELDAMIEMLNAGAAYPRSNVPIPSSLWTTQINSPFQLGALDFFERGETIQFIVTPTHVNNPPAGNLSAYAAGGLFPFLGSQYDVHEGINDQLDTAATTADPITRLPDGILHIGLHGFRIVQPPGPVRLI